MDLNCKEEIKSNNCEPASNTSTIEINLEEKEIVDELLHYTAQTGKLKTDWIKFKKILEKKTKTTCDQYKEKYPDLNGNKSVTDYDCLINSILENINKFQNNPPFTIQRICEILFEPERYYKSSRKILFALNKLFDLDV